MAMMSYADLLRESNLSSVDQPHHRAPAAPVPDKNQELDDMALDRLKSAGSPFELEKAQAIAAYVQWRIERDDHLQGL